MTDNKPLRRHNSTFRVKPQKRKSRAPLKCRRPMSRRGGKPEVGSVKDLENQLDELVRRVLRREQDRCFTCGTRGSQDNPLQVSHLFTRAWRPTRFDVHPGGNNCMMCKRCNERHEADPMPYRKAFIARYGKEALMEIGRRAQESGKRTYLELNAMILQREAMLK